MSVSLSEDQDNLLRAKEAMDVERENLRTDARTLANLRSEHARLKDDFRSLFTSNERVKNEYCNLQTEYKSLKTSYNQLKLQQTELKVKTIPPGLPSRFIFGKYTSTICLGVN